jgi:hypothetical protein
MERERDIVPGRLRRREAVPPPPANLPRASSIAEDLEDRAGVLRRHRGAFGGIVGDALSNVVRPFLAPEESLDPRREQAHRAGRVQSSSTSTEVADGIPGRHVQPDAVRPRALRQLRCFVHVEEHPRPRGTGPHAREANGRETSLVHPTLDCGPDHPSVGVHVDPADERRGTCCRCPKLVVPGDDLSGLRGARHCSIGGQSGQAHTFGNRGERGSEPECRGNRRSGSGRRFGASKRSTRRNDPDRGHGEGTTHDHPPPSAGSDRYGPWDAFVVVGLDGRTGLAVARRLRLLARSPDNLVGRRSLRNSIQGCLAPGTGPPLTPARPVTAQADPFATSQLAPAPPVCSAASLVPMSKTS